MESPTGPKSTLHTMRYVRDSYQTKNTHRATSSVSTSTSSFPLVRHAHGSPQQLLLSTIRTQISYYWTYRLMTPDMTIVERFSYVVQSHMAFQNALSAVISNTLPCPPRINLMQPRDFVVTLRTTRTQPPCIPYVLVCHSANHHYDHPYNSTQCGTSTMAQNL